MDSIVINGFSQLNLNNDSIVTIGKFDSVHRGHQKLLKYTVKYALKHNLISIAILIKKRNVAIYYIEDSINIIKSIGINYIIVIDFLPEFYTIDATEFFNKLISYYRMKHIAVGVDFAFGKDRVGDREFLYKKSKEYNTDVTIVPFLFYKGDRVSSSRIRESLSNGKIFDVNRMLGRNYTLRGRVIHGNALGRKIGYPTANLEIFPNLFIPKMGVYSSLVKIDDSENLYQALTFIGISNINNELRVESHILDFSADIYEHNITIILLKYVRDNIKVNSIEEVKKLLEKDEKKIRKYFKRRTKCLSQQTKN